jgi:hypothetical protein
VANAKSIEKLCLEKPECLLESIQKLRPEEQTKIIKFFLIAPLFHEENEMRKALERHSDEFRTIKELYSKLKQASEQLAPPDRP